MSKYWEKKIKHLFVAGLYQLILVSKPIGDIQYHCDIGDIGDILVIYNITTEYRYYKKLIIRNYF